MFDELKIRLAKNRFATPTNEEAQLVLEVLDEAIFGLEKISPPGTVHATHDYDGIRCQETLEKMEFISKRPIGQERKTANG
jgi:hypothetical protein